MKKKRGAISLAIALLLVLIFSFFLVSFDINRRALAKEGIERSLKNSLDSALANYDDMLFSKYGIMAIPEAKKPHELVNSNLKYCFEFKRGTWNFEHYSLDSSNVEAGGFLDDTDAIKLSIMNTHKKTFIAEKLTSFLEKLEIIKNLPSYASAVSAYSKAISELAKLKTDYDKLLESFESLKKVKSSLEGMNIAENLKKILDLKDRLLEIKQSYEQTKIELIDLATELENPLAQSSGVKGESASEKEKKKEELRTKLTDLKSEEDSTSKTLEILESRVDKLISLDEGIIDFCKGVSDFAKSCSNTSIKVRKRIEKSFDGGKFDENTKEIADMGMEILEKLESAAISIENTSHRLEPVLKDVNEQLSEIKSFLSKTTELIKKAELADISFASLSDIASIKDIFGELIAKGSDNTLGGIASLIWDAMNGKLLPAFANIEVIDSSKMSALPSKNAGAKNKKKPSKRPRAGKSLNTAAIDEVSSCSDELSNTRGLFDLNTLFDKLVIGDYALEKFSHYNFDNPDTKAIFGGAEIEYILSGNGDSASNLAFTQFKIFSVRMVFNTVSILIHRSSEIAEISAKISSFSVFIPYPVIYGIVGLGWSAIESIADLKSIDSGNSVLILKGDKDIGTSLNANSIIDSDRVLHYDKELSNDEDKSKLCMDYKDYLLLFLAIENENETLLRIADLISLKEGIDPSAYATNLKANIRVAVPKFFPKARNEFELSNDEINSYETTLIRGY